jgi:ABC-type Na+ transport system ATPase subunit NatA
LISILTGMTAPTSGTAVVCGYDIRKDMPKARKHLGTFFAWHAGLGASPFPISIFRPLPPARHFV